MSNKFDNFVQELQEHIFDETREEYGEWPIKDGEIRFI